MIRKIILIPVFLFITACELSPYNKMVDDALTKAEAGDVEAQFLMAYMYALNKGAIQDFKQAVDWLTKVAEQGDVYAQNELGGMYFYGNGTRQDTKQAIVWWTKAAEQGYAMAQSNMGLMYAKGWGVTQNYKQSFDWYSKAAEQRQVDAHPFPDAVQNNVKDLYAEIKIEVRQAEAKATKEALANAQNNLGMLYEEGNGVTQDYNMAYQWFSLAAESGLSPAKNNRDRIATKLKRLKTEVSELMQKANAGDAVAQNNLGVAYQHGKGVEQDYKQAFDWYSKAAEQGQATGQFNLGYLYFSGQGVIQDYKRSYIWLSIAAANGEPRALTMSATVGEKLTREELEEAQSEVVSLLRNIEKNRKKGF